MVALSVSISASTSPFLTASPTFLCQEAMTPSVIVSLSRGINTTSSIEAASIAGALAAGAGIGVGCGATASCFAGAAPPLCCATK